MIKIDVTKTTTICGALGVDADRVVVLCEKAQEIAIASIAIRKINKPKAGSTQQVTPQGEA